MKWLPFSSTATEPKYHHPASADDVRGEVARWKRRYYTLAIIYVVTVLLGVAYFPMSDAVATGAVLSEAYFGNIPKEMVKFKLNEAYVEEVSGTPQNRSVWDMLLPLGAGFVEVRNPMNYGLKGGFPVRNTEVMTEIYSISMFHQIYCLSMLKEAFGRDGGASKNRAEENNLNRCFDYLRQAIMCAGDTTLETALVGSDGVMVPGFDGWGDVHECRSFEAIFDFAAAHRVKDRTCLM